MTIISSSVSSLRMCVLKGFATSIISGCCSSATRDLGRVTTWIRQTLCNISFVRVFRSMNCQPSRRMVLTGVIL